MFVTRWRVESMGIIRDIEVYWWELSRAISDKYLSNNTP